VILFIEAPRSYLFETSETNQIIKTKNPEQMLRILNI
jgi:hypothetical protein